MRKRSFLFRTVAILILAGTAVMLKAPQRIETTWEKVRHSPWWGLTSLVVKGNRAVSDTQIMELSNLKVGDNILLLDLKKAADQISRHPWVQSCRIQRILPHRLAVTIIERQPKALLQNGERFMVVDKQGEPIQEASSPWWAKGLPIVTVESSDSTVSQEVQKSLAVLKKITDFNGVLPEVSEIVVLSKNFLEIYPLNRSWRVMISDKGVDEALRRWASLSSVIDTYDFEIAAIDLRFKGRAYLRRKEETSRGT